MYDELGSAEDCLPLPLLDSLSAMAKYVCCAKRWRSSDIFALTEIPVTLGLQNKTKGLLFESLDQIKVETI